jgi:RNA polymerase sigma-70 factor (ECF subfamily)
VSANGTSIDRYLSAARAGSRDALGRALQEYRLYLLEIAREEIDRALQAKGGASDLVQETFLEAARDFTHFHGQSALELRAWLRCLLLRRVVKHGRRFRKTHKRRIGCEVALEAVSDGLIAHRETPSAGVAADEELQLIQGTLKRLPEDYQRVIRLRYEEGRTFEEIGPLMGRTANAVRLLWLRAIERVKQELRPPSHG